jgi:DNA ligase-1
VPMTTLSKPFRLMLAFDADMDYYANKLSKGHVYWASPKMDGIRAVVINGQLMSRTMKPIRNVHTQKLFGRPEFEGLDGELIVGEPCGEGVFNRTTSGVMSADGEPNVWFHVFDDVFAPGDFLDRHRKITHRKVTELFNVPGITRIQSPMQIPINTVDDLEVAEKSFVDLGYEGLILKSPRCPYKQGRSTAREGYMGKLKRFKDSEAVITGFEEMLHNDNPATIDARGYTTRSTHTAGQRPSGMLGTLRVQDLHNPSWAFGIGSGLDHALRQEIWNNRESYTGKVVRYKYLPVGTIDLPRHPILTGFRDRDDV